MRLQLNSLALLATALFFLTVHAAPQSVQAQICSYCTDGLLGGGTCREGICTSCDTCDAIAVGLTA